MEAWKPICPLCGATKLGRAVSGLRTGPDRLAIRSDDGFKCDHCGAHIGMEIVQRLSLEGAMGVWGVTE